MQKKIRNKLFVGLSLGIFFICHVYNTIALATPNLSSTDPVNTAILTGEIALSLDDAPMPSTLFSKGIKRTQEIIRKLQEVDAPSIGIFSVAEYISNQDGKERIQLYGRAGHIIANHSYSHLRLNQVGPEKFIQDIQKAHAILSVFPNFKPFFRFPYLEEGKTAEERQQVMEALKKMGYQEGYVTVSNHEYRLNQLFLQAVKNRKAVDYDKLRTLYTTILWDCIKTNQKMAYKTLNRDVKHVLLLHENDLAALFIGDLINYIRSQGWKVIPIEQAYQDPLSQIAINHTNSGRGRIFSVAIEQGISTEIVSFPPTVEYSYIKKAVREQSIFSNPSPHK